jgi:hypothetical protein
VVAIPPYGSNVDAKSRNDINTRVTRLEFFFFFANRQIGL